MLGDHEINYDHNDIFLEITTDNIYVVLLTKQRYLKIRINRKANPKITGKWLFDIMLPAIYHQNIINALHYANDVVTKASNLPGVDMLVKHPLTGIEAKLFNVVINLNDVHKWTRNQIADWIESFDEIPTFTPPEVGDHEKDFTILVDEARLSPGALGYRNI